MTTAQNILDDSRNTLNDAKTSGSDSACRFTDLDLLVGYNDGLKLVRALRPDLWYGSLGTPLASQVLGSTFPLAPEFEPAMKKYIIHYAEMRDDEYVVSGRAEAFLKQFYLEIAGGK